MTTGPSHPASGAGVQVLVVDDDSIRTVVRWQLEEDGYSVLEASDGSAALGLIQSRQPDLVVLDLTLPRVGGPPAAPQARRPHGTRRRSG